MDYNKSVPQSEVKSNNAVLVAASFKIGYYIMLGLVRNNTELVMKGFREDE